MNRDAGVGRNVMSEERDTDETAEQRDSINRRRFVRTLGVAGGAAAFGSLGVGSTSAQETNGNVRYLSGHEKNKVVSKALTDSDTRDLETVLEERGWTANRNRATAQYMDPNDETSFVFVTVPISTDDESINATLTWTDHYAGDNTVISVLKRGTSSLLNYKIEDGEVVKERKGSKESDDKNITIQSGPGAGPGCVYMEKECNNLNWTCIGALAVTYGSCAWAVVKRDIGEIAACVGAAGMTIIQAADNEGCNVCDSTNLEAYNLCRS